jgi:hypothetical protein
VLYGPNRIFHGTYDLWYAPGALTRQASDVPRPMDIGSSTRATATGLTGRSIPGAECQMHCEDVDIEHSTCKPKDSVKRQPCALKMTLRLGEMTERGAGEDRTVDRSAEVCNPSA